MATLFEIRKEIADCFDAETGEIFDEEKFDKLEMAEFEKIENTAMFIKNLELDAKNYEEMEKAFADKKKSCKKKIEQMKDHLNFVLEHQNFKGNVVDVRFRKSKKVDVDENYISLLPEEFKTEKVSVNPDKKAIKAALENGDEIRGCRLVENYSCTIK